MPIATEMLQVLVHNTVSALTTAKQMQGVWRDALRSYRAEAEREGDAEAAELLESVSRLTGGEDPDAIAPRLSGDYAECWQQILNGLQGESQPQSAYAAVMDFLNAPDEEQRQQVVRDHAEILFSPEAESLLEDAAQQYRGDSRMSGLIASRRQLLQNCRQQGIEQAFSAGPPRVTPAEPQPSLSPLFARELGMAFDARGVAAEAVGAELRRAGETIEVHAEIEQQVGQGGRFLVGIRLELTIDGRPAPALTTGLVGVGSTEDEAITGAVTEWGQVVGSALAMSRGSGQGSDGVECFRYRSYRICPGATAVRGSLPVDWNQQGHVELMQVLGPVLDQLDPAAAAPHAFSLAVGVDETGRVNGGSTKLDGQESAELMQATSSYSWPASGSVYMFKQFYLIEKAS